MGDGLSLQITAVLNQDGRYPQVTPVLTHDGRALPEVTISKKDCRPGRQPTGRRSLKKTDGTI